MGVQFAAGKGCARKKPSSQRLHRYAPLCHLRWILGQTHIFVTGRSVKVFNGNIAEAFKRLEQCLSRNRVRSELKLTERHEKKGAKRRRLESERWRIRFANEV